jgi:hypothetical protein
VSARIDDVMTTLVSTFAALPALAGVDVRDGPPLDGMGDSDFVIIGHDGAPDSTAESVFQQEWTDLACTRRTESGEVICCCVSNTGDTDMAVRRTRAFALLAACETALVGDMTLGGVVLSAQLTGARVEQYSNPKGVAVVAPFTVTYRAIV